MVRTAFALFFFSVFFLISPAKSDDVEDAITKTHQAFSDQAENKGDGSVTTDKAQSTEIDTSLNLPISETEKVLKDLDDLAHPKTYTSEQQKKDDLTKLEDIAKYLTEKKKTLEGLKDNIKGKDLANVDQDARDKEANLDAKRLDKMLESLETQLENIKDSDKGLLKKLKDQRVVEASKAPTGAAASGAAKNPTGASGGPGPTGTATGLAAKQAFLAQMVQKGADNRVYGIGNNDAIGTIGTDGKITWANNQAPAPGTALRLNSGGPGGAYHYHVTDETGQVKDGFADLGTVIKTGDNQYAVLKGSVVKGVLTGTFVPVNSNNLSQEIKQSAIAGLAQNITGAQGQAARQLEQFLKGIQPTQPLAPDASIQDKVAAFDQVITPMISGTTTPGGSFDGSASPAPRAAGIPTVTPQTVPPIIVTPMQPGASH